MKKNKSNFFVFLRNPQNRQENKAIRYLGIIVEDEKIATVFQVFFTHLNFH